MTDWLPKSVLCLREYSLQKFLSDLLAGITVGLVALPLALAFAIASRMPASCGVHCSNISLVRLAGRLHACGRALILCGARHQPARAMGRAEFERHVGPENICPDVEQALKRAEQVHRVEATA